MNSKWKKTTSLLCALTVAAVPMALNVGAGAPENSDKGVLVDEAVQIGEAYVEGYMLTIPASFDIQNEGWNEIGDISAVGHLAEGKKLVVSADSANHWCLKKEGADEEINYYIRGNAEGEEVYSWEFNELSETPATRKIGVDVEPFKGKPAGEYTDVLTFTASVEDNNVVKQLNVAGEAFNYYDGATWATAVEMSKSINDWYNVDDNMVWNFEAVLFHKVNAGTTAESWDWVRPNDIVDPNAEYKWDFNYDS